jgi:3-methyladenine DNA glycosylase AlkD
VRRRALADLQRLGSPVRAEGAAGYFKAYEKLRFFGVDTPTVRRMASEIRKTDARDWQIRDAVVFADAMITQPELEAKVLGVCVLARFRGDFVPSLLERARRWLANHCTDWASTDALCGEIIGPLLISHPELVPRLRAWRRSRHLYVRRASAVALIPLLRRGEALDDGYDAALTLGGDPHHLLQKAAGWVLREAGKRDMGRLEAFLRKDGPRLSRTTISYAAERFDGATREAIMRATRPKPSTDARKSVRPS